MRSLSTAALRVRRNTSSSVEKLTVYAVELRCGRVLEPPRGGDVGNLRIDLAVGNGQQRRMPGTVWTTISRGGRSSVVGDILSRLSENVKSYLLAAIEERKQRKVFP